MSFLLQEIAKHLLAQSGGSLELALDHVNARLGGDVVNGGLAQPPAPSSGFVHPSVVRKSSQVGRSKIAFTMYAVIIGYFDKDCHNIKKFYRTRGS